MKKAVKKKVSKLGLLKKKLNCSRCKRISTIECYKCGMFEAKAKKKATNRTPVEIIHTPKKRLRVIGYFLSVGGKLDTGTKPTTKAKAMELATNLLSIVKKPIDVVRANDKIILMTFSLNTKGGLQVEKR